MLRKLSKLLLILRNVIRKLRKLLRIVRNVLRELRTLLRILRNTAGPRWSAPERDSLRKAHHKLPRKAAT